MQHECSQRRVVHFGHENHGVGAGVEGVGSDSGAVVRVEGMHQTNDLVRAMK